MSTLLPTLSTSSWVTDSNKILDRILSYFIVADYSQSIIYFGNVTSLPKIIQSNQGNIPRTISAIESQLSLMINRYFKESTVEVVDKTNSDEPSKVILSIYVSAVDFEGKTVNFGKLLEIQDTIVKKIVDINNG